MVTDDDRIAVWSWEPLVNNELKLMVKTADLQGTGDITGGASRERQYDRNITSVASLDWW